MIMESIPEDSGSVPIGTDPSKMKTRVLSVATAGLEPDRVGDGDSENFPRVDYLELGKYLDADTIDYSVYNHSQLGSLLRNIETQLRSDIYLASLGYFKSRFHDVVFAWSERAGIPLAGFWQVSPRRKTFISMFQCWSQRQEIMVKRLNLFSRMDAIIVHCESMRRHLISIGAPAEKVHLIHYSVDQQFYQNRGNVDRDSNIVMSIGEPRSRDYQTLVEASKGLPITMEIAASGHWYAREKGGMLPEELPDNIKILKHLPKRELRELYARSRIVVLPIQDVVFSAGATAILESSCMQKAIIVTRSRGIQDYVIDGETGIVVEPGDVKGMHEAMHYLLSNPGEARRLGQNARQRIEEQLNLETYVGKIASLIMDTAQPLSLAAGSN
jgi:glycosyltransferase involved in cell wall biosynthesis